MVRSSMLSKLLGDDKIDSSTFAKPNFTFGSEERNRQYDTHDRWQEKKRLETIAPFDPEEKDIFNSNPQQEKNNRLLYETNP